MKRPWYRDPSVIISTLAFLFSLSTTVFSYLQAQQQRVHDLRSEVRAGLLEFQKLAIDTIKSQEQYRSDARFAGLIGDKAGSALSILATRVSELALEIAEQVSVREHLAIATVLSTADRDHIAAIHGLIAARRAKDPQDRVDAFRVLAFSAASQRDLPAMRTYFQDALNASETIPSPAMVHWSTLGTLQVWSVRELTAKQCTEFARLRGLADS